VAIATPEIASLVGALDDAAFTDGSPVSAYVQRTIAMSANRLRSKGHPLISWAWDIDNAGGAETVGGMFTWGVPKWIQILPGPVPVFKKPGLEFADAKLVAKITGTDEMYFQIATSRHPYDPAARTGDANVITVTGDGSPAFDLHGLDVTDGLRIAYGNMDTISVYCRGAPTTTAMVTGTYGSPASGTLDQSGDWVQRDHIVDASATWNVSGNTPATGGHAIYFENSAGVKIGPPRTIIKPDARTTHIYFWPELTTEEQRLFNEATYSIVKLPEIQMAGLTIHCADRGAVLP
jgi:hypothetical protein